MNLFVPTWTVSPSTTPQYFFQNASEIDQLSDRLMEVQTQLDNVTKENVTLTQSWRAMESEVNDM